MGSSNPNRRRSMSLSASPYASQSDTTSSSSPFTWNSNGGPKSYFLSRFKASNTTPPISPTSSTSTSLSSLPPIHGQKTVKRKPIVSAATSPVPISQKMFESGLGTQTEELTLLAENTTTKKVRYIQSRTLFSFNMKFKYSDTNLLFIIYLAIKM